MEAIAVNRQPAQQRVHPPGCLLLSHRQTGQSPTHADIQHIDMIFTRRIQERLPSGWAKGMDKIRNCQAHRCPFEGEAAQFAFHLAA